LCAGNTTEAGSACQLVGQAGDEAACQGQFGGCLAQCAPSDLSSSHHDDYASYCGQLANFCHTDTTALGVACHDLGHGGDEAACRARRNECLAQCAPSQITDANFRQPGTAHAH
jgi:hypothetical protein